MVLTSVKLDPEISDRYNDIYVIPWSMNNEKDLQTISDFFFPTRDVTQFMNIIPGDGWEKEKERIMIEMGFETVNLVDPQCPRKIGENKEPISATLVRQYYNESDPKWKKLVPPGTRSILLKLKENPNAIDTKYQSLEEYLRLFPRIDTRAIAKATLPHNIGEQEIYDQTIGVILEQVNDSRPNREG